MSATLETTPAEPVPVTDAARDMRQTMGAVKLSFSWLGTQRKLEDGQIRQAADTFGADKEAVTASKKLIDTKHPAYRAVTLIKSQAAAYWRSMTMPYPQEGVRLIRRDDIEQFETRMNQFREELTAAVENLRTHYDDLKAATRERLGALYNPADLPDTLEGVFNISWEYPAVDPPQYLMRFNPALYQQEQERVQQRFETAVLMTENAFAEQLQALVAHLIERLSDSPDGTAKTFRPSTIENFKEFAAEFRKLNVRGNTELDRLIAQAESLVAGVTPAELRKSATLRSEIAERMQEVQTTLDTLVTNAPRRRLMELD